jgi:hypothetical protein
LTQKEREMLPLLKKAAEVMDELFGPAYGDKLTLLAKTKDRMPGASWNQLWAKSPENNVVSRGIRSNRRARITCDTTKTSPPRRRLAGGRQAA